MNTYRYVVSFLFRDVEGKESFTRQMHLIAEDEMEAYKKAVVCTTEYVRDHIIGWAITTAGNGILLYNPEIYTRGTVLDLLL
jgi:hypothetical protein